MNIPLSTPPSSDSAPVVAGPRQRLARIVGWSIGVSFILGALVFLYYLFEDWRGERVWAVYAKESLARNWRFDWEYYAPPQVPMDDNFAAAPVLAPLFEFEMDSQYWRDTNAVYRVFKLDDRLRGMASAKGLGLAKMKTPRFETGRRADLSGILPVSNQSTPGTNTNSSARAAAKSLKQLLDECCGPVFVELREASRRPMARYNIQYGVKPLATIFLPHLPAVQHLAQGLSLHAFACLELNDVGEAFEDVLLINYLGDSLRGEPFLISHHTRLACRAIAAQVIYEGLAGHKWSDTQLKSLQAGLAKDYFAADSFQSMLAERAYNLRLVDELCTRTMSVDMLPGKEKPKDLGWWISVIPIGWFYIETINIGKGYDTILLAMEEWLQGKRDIKSALLDTAVWAGDRSETAKTASLKSEVLSHRVLMPLLGPAVNKSFVKSLQAQVRTEQIIAACAVERYRLAKGEYPETLDVLAPHYLQNPPQDPFAKAPLKYRRQSPGGYVLYSIGSNCQDDGGKVELDAKGAVQSDKGDLVWRIQDNG